jgi:molybdate transport system permease protein
LPDLTPLWLSLKVALGATGLVLPLGTWVAWRLSRSKKSFARAVVETVVTLPLVLPPTAVGFYLLLVLGRGTALGRFVNDSLGLRLLFTWEGAALAAAVMALPLFVRTAESAFASVDRELLEMARTLGAEEADLLLKVIAPLAFRGLLAASTLAFARALGEFGATMIVAGSLPGRTQTAPIALYQSVEAGRDADALFYSLALTGLTLVLVASMAALRRRMEFLRTN